MEKTQLAIITTLTILLPIIPAWATVPEILPVQGFLTDATGVAIDGPTDLEFALFNAETGGNELWRGIRTGHKVIDGHFTVYLGKTTPLNTDSLLAVDELWLEITADGDVMTRMRLGSVPFALEAQVCRQVGNISEADIQRVLSGTCQPGEYIDRIDSLTGIITCSKPPDTNTQYDGTTFALSNKKCGSNEFMTGIDATGNPLCTSMTTWVNNHCYVYFGWKDSCDGCTTFPDKYGRTRGNTSSGCSTTGTDNSCQNFTINSQAVRMMGLNMDGDVNGDDKFWIGIKCQ